MNPIPITANTIYYKLAMSLSSSDPDKSIKEYFMDFLRRNPSRGKDLKIRVNSYCPKYKYMLDKIMVLL